MLCHLCTVPCARRSVTMVKKVLNRGRPCKKKRVPNRLVASAASVAAKAKAKAKHQAMAKGKAKAKVKVQVQVKVKAKAKAKPFKALAASKAEVDPGPANPATGPVIEPCVFPCPSLRRVSNEALPRMGAVVDCKDEESGIRILGSDDLDALQLELETLLSSVVLRTSQLNDQLSVINSLETIPQGRGRKQRKARAVIPAPAPLPPPPPTDEKPTISRPPVKIPIKKLGNAPPAVPSLSSQPPCKRSKMLRKRPDVAPKTKPRGKLLEKDFISHKFWNALDPYCCEITEDTYNLLSDILYQNQTDVPFFYSVPPLGEHFSKEWEIKDYVENQDSDNTSSSVSLPLTPSSPVSNNSTPSSESIGNAIRRKFRECSMALKRSLCSSPDKAAPSVSPPPTPATSKLMAALLGELPPPVAPLQECRDRNVIIKIEKDDEDKFSIKTSRPNSACGSTTNNETPRKHQRRCLDRKFRLEKEAQGEIETSVRNVITPQSLLDELKRTQADLKLVVDQNSRIIDNLTNNIAKEFKLQVLKRKLQEIDDSVLDIYHTRTAAKLAKQVISQEDVDQAWRALKERDQIIKQINLFEHRWSPKVLSDK